MCSVQTAMAHSLWLVKLKGYFPVRITTIRTPRAQTSGEVVYFSSLQISALNRAAGPSLSQEARGRISAGLRRSADGEWAH